MNHLLLSIATLLMLTALVIHLNKKEKFNSFVHGIVDPIQNVAEYIPMKCDKSLNKPCFGDNKIYTYLPYEQKPVESQVFCPSAMLYNTSCYPHQLKDKLLSNSLSGPYTVPLNKNNAPEPISSYFPQTLQSYKYPLGCNENINCVTDNNNVNRCGVGRNGL